MILCVMSFHLVGIMVNILMPLCAKLDNKVLQKSKVGICLLRLEEQSEYKEFQDDLMRYVLPPGWYNGQYFDASVLKT